MFRRLITLAYGVTSYALFVTVFTYAILFIGNVVVTPSLDSPGNSDIVSALAIDLGLLGLFALQHSIMARPWFKRLVTVVIPSEIERSTYVLASTIIMAAIVYFWQPLGGILWQLTDPMAITALYTVFCLGWAILFLSSFQLNHFDLFGLRQVWLSFKGVPYTELEFKTPWLYRRVRHPLYVGLIIGLWATPIMSVAHFVFALACTAYIVIGAKLEERDLLDALPEYGQYRNNVPMFIPALIGKHNSQA